MTVRPLGTLRLHIAAASLFLFACATDQQFRQGAGASLMGLGGLAVIVGASDDSDCLPESSECIASNDPSDDENELAARAALLGGGSAAVALGAALMKYRPAKATSLRSPRRSREPVAVSFKPKLQLVDPALREIVQGADPPAAVPDLRVPKR